MTKKLRLVRRIPAFASPCGAFRPVLPQMVDVDRVDDAMADANTCGSCFDTVPASAGEQEHWHMPSPARYFGMWLQV